MNKLATALFVAALLLIFGGFGAELAGLAVCSFGGAAAISGRTGSATAEAGADAPATSAHQGSGAADNAAASQWCAGRRSD